jgi:hypothetical protein
MFWRFADTLKLRLTLLSFLSYYRFLVSSTSDSCTYQLLSLHHCHTQRGLAEIDTPLYLHLSSLLGS